MNISLASAFPLSVRSRALRALEQFPEPELPSASPFLVKVAGETVSIPYRIYYDPTAIHSDELPTVEKEIIDCLLTRHSSGFVRQQRLARIIHSGNVWTPPFVLQLVGEYVIQIVDVIQTQLGELNRDLYRDFLIANPEFLRLTARRVQSYWDRYHRTCDRSDYVGFKALKFFESLVPEIF